MNLLIYSVFGLLRRAEKYSTAQYAPAYWVQKNYPESKNWILTTWFLLHPYHLPPSLSEIDYLVCLDIWHIIFINTRLCNWYRFNILRKKNPNFYLKKRRKSFHWTFLTERLSFFNKLKTSDFICFTFHASIRLKIAHVETSSLW